MFFHNREFAVLIFPHDLISLVPEIPAVVLAYKRAFLKIRCQNSHAACDTWWSTKQTCALCHAAKTLPFALVGLEQPRKKQILVLSFHGALTARRKNPFVYLRGRMLDSLHPIIR